jgi:hypothetical protein
VWKLWCRGGGGNGGGWGEGAEGGGVGGGCLDEVPVPPLYSRCAKRSGAGQGTVYMVGVGAGHGSGSFMCSVSNHPDCKFQLARRSPPVSGLKLSWLLAQATQLASQTLSRPLSFANDSSVHVQCCEL